MKRAKFGQFVPIKRCARGSRYLFENRIRITLSAEEHEHLNRYMDAAGIAQVVRQLAMRLLIALTRGEPIKTRECTKAQRVVRANVNLSGQQLDALERYMEINRLASHADAIRSLALGGADFMRDNGGEIPAADIKPDPDRQTLDPQALMVT